MYFVDPPTPCNAFLLLYNNRETIGVTVIWRLWLFKWCKFSIKHEKCSIIKICLQSTICLHQSNISIHQSIKININHAYCRSNQTTYIFNHEKNRSTEYKKRSTKSSNMHILSGLDFYYIVECVECVES